jgi:hypothetical protein
LDPAAGDRFLPGECRQDAQDVTVEVDRYIVWPGQAGYKIGQLKIASCGRMRKRSSARFDVRKFHDVVLGRAPCRWMYCRNEWLNGSLLSRGRTGRRACAGHGVVRTSAEDRAAVGPRHDDRDISRRDATRAVHGRSPIAQGVPASDPLAGRRNC